MSPSNAPTTPRGIVDEVLGRRTTQEVWTSNYEKALPISVRDFELSAVLPAVFYMFRFAHRRGKGRFLETFGGESGTPSERRRAATIERIADVLAQNECFDGFAGPTEKAILGDLLLSFCLENAKRALGRTEQVQRVLPTHYMASWIDLPEAVANLRYVPEMIVAMLADQQGDYVEQNQEGDKNWFAVGRDFAENLLLRAFCPGVVRKGQLADRKADRFQEDTPVGLDQLLMIRLALQLGEAPDKLRGREGDRISNQRPIAERAARLFSEDIRRFVRAYAGVMPRHAFVELLESCMAVGLFTIVTSVIEILFEWAETGEVRKKCKQRPTMFFVDCSNGTDRDLRGVAEQSADEFFRRIERFPVVLMALRLLEDRVRYDPELKKLNIETRPYATEWLNLLGELLFKRRQEANDILRDLERKAAQLAERLEQEDYSEASEILRNEQTQPSPVWRMAEALTFLQGRKNTVNTLTSLIDSSLLIDRPNGLAKRRAVFRKSAPGGGTRMRDVRSLVFTDAVLDYLVHRHVLPSGNKPGYQPLSLKRFLNKLKDDYGFCVDSAPSGMTISNDLLQRNRAVLERRLRDLGLLLGVNDAEEMKHLKPRFERPEENHAADESSCQTNGRRI